MPRGAAARENAGRQKSHGRLSISWTTVLDFAWTSVHSPLTTATGTRRPTEATGMTKAEQKAARTALMESIYAGSVGTSVERSLPRAKFIGPGAEAIYAARVARCNEVEAEMRAEGFFDLVAS